MDKQKPVPRKLLLNPIHFLSLGFGSGLSPKMPGTMGSLAGLSLYLLLPELDWRLYLGIVIIAFLIGIYLCASTAKALNTHDHPAIVWDEIVGVWITLFMVPKEWLWIMLGFILFRGFDILKPGPIAWLDRRLQGGTGIMLDDVVAAIFSLIIIQVILYLL